MDNGFLLMGGSLAAFGSIIVAIIVAGDIREARMKGKLGGTLATA